ncbi:MAG TPA: gliding motility protein GldM [Cyclobacteriaceae bacterium]|nr:gliding motility protein GldM [Cyclobacteriaceae bacterium]
MAGKKETPRQKMIGMMYLVLTALLALQVSNAVLEKFAVINATLEAVKNEGDKKNNEALASIIQEAGKSQKPQVLKAKENAQKVRELTQSTMKTIEELKAKMLKESGTDKVDESFINDHSMKVATMMIAPKSPEGKNFEKLLSNYVAQLAQLTGLKFDPIAKAPKDIPLFANDPDHNSKDYLTFNFENTPPVAAYVTVTQVQTEVLANENKALEELRRQAGAGKISFDNIVPMVRPEASVVAAGAKYKAQMFITASSSAIIPEFYMNGEKLPVVDDPQTGVKMGQVEFNAQGGGYDANGMAKKSFTAKIQLADTSYTKVIEYFVAQPVIKVTTGNAPTLYMNCGNTVNIEVPTLGTNYNPSFSPSGAEVIKGDKPGRVTIIPSQRKVTVTVSNGGVNLGNVQFDVKPIPRPRFVAKDNSGKDVDMKLGVKSNLLTGLRIVAEAEENFKQEVPKDAIYRIRTMEVIHARGTAPIHRMQASNEVLDLATWRSGFKPGDQIVVEIKTVTRRTYKGEDEKVDIRSEIIRVPIQ